MTLLLLVALAASGAAAQTPTPVEATPEAATPMAPAPTDGTPTTPPTPPATTTTSTRTPPASLPSAWAPPTTGAPSGVFAAAQVFAGFEAPTSPAQDELWSRFDLQRAEVGGGFVWERTLQAVVRLEAVRSASAQSAFGIDRNSLLPRFRLAYGAYTPSFSLWGVDVAVTTRLGLVPEAWLERVEGKSATRGLLPLPSERAGLLGTSDLGAQLAISVHNDVVTLVAQVSNGEGKTEVELNDGKNVQVLLGTTPLRVSLFDEELSLSADVGFRDGSVGLSTTRDHRGLLALTASHPWFHVGVEGAWAWGVNGRGDREVLVVGGWADAPLWPGFLGAVGRYDLQAELSADAPDARIHRLAAGLFTDFGHPEVVGRAEGALLRRLRLYATVDATVPEAGAAIVSPDAASALRVLLTLEATGVTDVISTALQP